jgi:NADH:ubiquinone oxidoreductase subunit H
MHHDYRIIIVFAHQHASLTFIPIIKKLVNNVMYCYVRNALPRVRLVSLVRLCYMFLWSCYLGDIVIVRP